MFAARLALTFAALLAITSQPLLAAAQDESPFSRVGGHVIRSVDGRVSDALGLAIRGEGTPRELSASILARASADLFGDGQVDLRLATEQQSLTGTHLLFRQFVDGVEVVNAGLAMSFDHEGALASIHNRTAIREACDPVTMSPDAAKLQLPRDVAGSAVEESRLVGLAGDDGVVRLYDRVVVREGALRWAWFVNASTGEIHHVEPLFQTVAGQVFDPNPVTTLNQPSLQDNDDSSAAVPRSAYVTVELQGLSGSRQLDGPNVVVTDLEDPLTHHPDPSGPLVFTRDQDEFEDVMVYFHVDRSQRYLQSLGFVGTKSVAAYPIVADAHAGTEDNSSYQFTTNGEGTLHFGDGGVDDAEDADIITHEYGHAIEDWIVPNGFSGISSGEPRALGEGFGDYWAFSAGYAASIASGRDPFCIGDWDARCASGPSTGCSYPAGADCLRRVDGTKTMDDFVRGGSNGIEHANGEIWSSALREIFVGAVARLGVEDGRRTTDRTVIESHFGLPPNPSFRTSALRLIDADRRLNDGLLSASICQAMTLRKILDASDCDLGLRGDLTLITAPAHGIPIPDNQPSGISSTVRIDDSRAVVDVFVKVDIAHPHRGDLRISLVGPDGTSAVLQVQNGDSASDIHATYGFDAESAQPLTVFSGKPATGVWTLIVSDNFGVDEGTLLGWSLLVRFAGDTPLTTRDAASAPSLVIPVSGSADGAAGTHFTSDVRLFNAGASDAYVDAFFTPSSSDGTTAFSALKLVIPRGQTVALDDVVGSYFRSSGLGDIGLRGDTANLIVTSRIYNEISGGTFGQFLRAVHASDSIGASAEPLEITQLQNTALFRSNAGVTEVAGSSGTVEIRLLAGDGAELGTIPFAIQPFSHVQVSVLGGITGTHSESVRAEVRVIGGAARVVAYGSVVDNLSGDAIFVPAARLPRQAAKLWIPAVIHADGANGTHWRSDLWIVNASTTAQTIGVRLLDGKSLPYTDLTVGPGATAVIEDVVARTFATEGAGVLEINGSALDRVLVTSRTWTPGASSGFLRANQTTAKTIMPSLSPEPPPGTFGQFVPAARAEDALSLGSGVRHLIQLDISPLFRTNIGISEIGGAPATVRVRLFDAAGTEKFTTDITAGASSNTQFNLQAAGAPAIGNGRVSLEVGGGSGRILGYASVVDNRTGDPIFVSAMVP